MKQLLQFRHNLMKIHSRSGYIVLLPEVPHTSENISKINLTSADKLPQFSQLSTEKCVTLMGQKIIEYETKVLSIDEKIIKEKEKLDLEDDKKKNISQSLFCSIFDSLEQINIQFDNTWAILKQLYFTSRDIMPPNIYLGIHNRAKQARHKKYTLKSLYNTCKSLDSSQLSEEHQRVLHKYLLESKLSGIEITNDQKFEKLIECNRYLVHKQRLFQLKLDSALKDFSFPINNLDLISEAPANLIKEMAPNKNDVTQGPWIARLTEPIKSKFMEYCSDRDRRYKMWMAEEKAASNLEENKQLNTSLVVEEIRSYRQSKAELLGYSNYLELSLETKMINNLEYLENILEEIRIKARLSQDTEVDNMFNFIDKAHPIQFWDVPYYTRLQKKKLYNYDENEWQNYFQFDKVLNTLFTLCTQLFDIKFEQVENFDTWNPNVRLYNIYDNNASQPIASFYIDPYANNNKLNFDQVIGLRTNSKVKQNVNPLSTLILNLDEPNYGKPCLLTFKQIENLFFQFGTILQRSLTLTNYTDVSGSNNIEWDSVYIINYFLTHWLYDAKTFNTMNEHYSTGEKLNNIDLVGLRSHNIGIDLCTELFKVNLDLKMHHCNTFWGDISRELYPLHFGFPIDKYSNIPCRFSEIFSGDFGGGYYSFLWSKIISADIYYAFKEGNNDIINQKSSDDVIQNTKIDITNSKSDEVQTTNATISDILVEDRSNVGHRIRDTFLTFGGSCHSSETFRRFRGRDPCYKPFLDLYNLK